MDTRQQLDDLPARTAQESDAASSSPAAEAFAPGAHLVTPRLGYTHHGIYVGGDRVVHYAGWSLALLPGPVEEVSLAEFAAGREVTVRDDSRAHFSPDEIVARARSRLGEDRYRLATNNCEHFCAWCLTGESRSRQIETIADRLRTPALALARMARAILGVGRLAAVARYLRIAPAPARA